MSPVTAVTQLLEDATGEFRQRMEAAGMTSTLAVRSDTKGVVYASIEFVVSKKLSEKLASESV